MKIVVLVLLVLISQYGLLEALDNDEVVALNALAEMYPQLASVPTNHREQTVDGVKVDLGPAWTPIDNAWCDSGPGWAHQGVHCTSNGHVDAMYFLTDTWGTPETTDYASLSGLRFLENLTFVGTGWGAIMSTFLGASLPISSWTSSEQPTLDMLKSNTQLRHLSIPVAEVIDFSVWSSLLTLEIKGTTPGAYVDTEKLPTTLLRYVAPDLCINTVNAVLIPTDLEYAHICTGDAIALTLSGYRPKLRELHWNLQPPYNSMTVGITGLSGLRTVVFKTTNTYNIRVTVLPPAITSLAIIGNTDDFSLTIPPALETLEIDTSRLGQLVGYDSLVNLTTLRLNAQGATWLNSMPSLSGTKIKTLVLRNTQIVTSTLANAICGSGATLRSLTLESTALSALPLCLPGLALETLDVHAPLEPSFLDQMPTASLKECKIRSLAPFVNGTFDWARFVNGRPALTSLDLTLNAITGPFPHEALTRLSALETLILANNIFTGSIPQNFFQKLPNLTIFNAAYNRMTGTIPMLGLENLERLNLGNNLFEAWPGISGSISKLQFLGVFNNLLTSFPNDPSFATATALLNFDISGNPLTGPMPAFWTSSTIIRDVSMSNCQLSGVIPSPIQTPRLNTLNLLNNALCGSVPRFVDSAPAVLSLSGNFLTGAVPSDWATSIFAPTQFDFSYNRLTGSLPVPLLSAYARRRISYLSIGTNLLEGPLPVFTPTWNPYMSFFATNTMFDFCDVNPMIPLSMKPTCSVLKSVKSTCLCPSLYVNCSMDGCLGGGEPALPTLAVYEDDAPACVQPSVRPPLLQCPQPIPQGFICVNGVMVATTTVTVPTIVFPPNSGTVQVIGNLTVGETLTFDGLGTTINVEGCLSLTSPNIVIQLQDDPSSDPIVLITQDEGCSQSLADLNIEIKQPKNCKKTIAKTEGSSPSTLVVVFSVDSSRCNVKWIILGSVLGGVIIIAVVTTILLATFNERCRKCIRPHARDTKPDSDK